MLSDQLNLPSNESGLEQIFVLSARQQLMDSAEVEHLTAQADFAKSAVWPMEQSDVAHLSGSAPIWKYDDAELVDDTPLDYMNLKIVQSAVLPKDSVVADLKTHVLHLGSAGCPAADSGDTAELDIYSTIEATLFGLQLSAIALEIVELVVQLIDSESADWPRLVAAQERLE